jgi:hypothetical protein
VSLPYINILIRLADAYKVSLDYLVGRTENKKGMYVSSGDENNDLSKRLAAIEDEIRLMKENK